MRIISNRISVDEQKGKVSVVILGKVARWKETLLLFWLLAWSFSGAVFLYYYFSPTAYQYSVVMLIFIAFWLYFELKIGKAFLWRITGYEHLVFENGKFSIRNKMKGFGKIRSYDADAINGFKKIEQSNKNFFVFMEQSFWVLGGEQIYFKYHRKDIIFGRQIDEREQKAVIRILNGALKNEKSKIRKEKRNLKD